MKFFVWIKDMKGFNPRGWTEIPKHTANSREIHPYEPDLTKAKVGDCVFKHEITPEDLASWEEKYMPGHTMSFLHWCSLRFPSPDAPRDQDKFPEGEG